MYTRLSTYHRSIYLFIYQLSISVYLPIGHIQITRFAAWSLPVVDPLQI